MKTRKGQVDDVLGDIGVSIIIIAIALIIISINNAGHTEERVYLKEMGKAELRALDLITLIRMPVNNTLLQEHGYGNANFAGFFELIARNYPENDPELEWMFGYGNLIMRDITSPKLACRDEFVKLVNERLGYTQWSIRLYGEKSRLIVFECDQISGKMPGAAGEMEVEIKTVTNTTIPMAEAGQNMIVAMEILP